MPKILLVEDNEMNREVLARRLIRKGYEPVFALDGAEGIGIPKLSEEIECAVVRGGVS